jgi:hypothetical protein
MTLGSDATIANSGNTFGVNISGVTVKSYGDNYILDNGTPVSGTLTPVSTQ